MKRMMLAVLMVIGLSACAALPFLSSPNQLESIIGVTVAGTYTVEVKKDGNLLVSEVWMCTTDGTKLTGCHKQ